MSNRYARVGDTESTRVSRDGSSIRSSTSRLNRQGSQATISYPDAEEMDAAFDDGSDSDSDEGHAQSRLLGRQDGSRQRDAREESQFQIGGDDSDEEDDAERKAGREVQDVFSDPLRQGGGDKPPSQLQTQNGRMPGDYDFDRDYVSIMHMQLSFDRIPDQYACIVISSFFPHRQQIHLHLSNPTPVYIPPRAMITESFPTFRASQSLRITRHIRDHSSAHYCRPSTAEVGDKVPMGRHTHLSLVAGILVSLPTWLQGLMPEDECRSPERRRDRNGSRRNRKRRRLL